MACDEMQERQFKAGCIAKIGTTIKHVKCDVNVSIKIKNPKTLHDWSHGANMTMCKLKKRSSMPKY